MFDFQHQLQKYKANDEQLKIGEESSSKKHTPRKLHILDSLFEIRVKSHFYRWRTKIFPFSNDTTFYGGSFFYFGGFLLVDGLPKFELEFLLVIYFATTNKKAPK